MVWIHCATHAHCEVDKRFESGNHTRMSVNNLLKCARQKKDVEFVTIKIDRYNLLLIED